MNANVLFPLRRGFRGGVVSSPPFSFIRLADRFHCLLPRVLRFGFLSFVRRFCFLGLLIQNVFTVFLLSHIMLSINTMDFSILNHLSLVVFPGMPLDFFDFRSPFSDGPASILVWLEICTLCNYPLSRFQRARIPAPCTFFCARTVLIWTMD